MSCLAEDLEASLAHLKLPVLHRRTFASKRHFGDDVEDVAQNCALPVQIHRMDPCRFADVRRTRTGCAYFLGRRTHVADLTGASRRSEHLCEARRAASEDRSAH